MTRLATTGRGLPAVGHNTSNPAFASNVPSQVWLPQPQADFNMRFSISRALRFAVRFARRRVTVTVTVILTASLGVGAVTATFSVLVRASRVNPSVTMRQ